MTQKLPGALYQQLITEYTDKLTAIKTRMWRASVARLLVFILVGTGIYNLFKQINTPTIVATIIALGIFLWLIKYSTRLGMQRTFFEYLVQINVNELGMLNGQPNQLEGESVEVPPQSYLEDLDVFGPASIFALLNRTRTPPGHSSLSGLLMQSLTDTTQIEIYQQAIKTFAPQTNCRQAILAAAMQVHAHQPNHAQLFSWVQQPLILPLKKWLVVASYILPVINIAAFLFNLQTGNYAPLILSIIASWCCIGTILKYTTQQGNIIGKKEAVLKAYALVADQFKTAEAKEAVLLQQLQQQMQRAATEIKKLSQLANLLDQRHNVLVNILLNSFLLYDVHCLAALEHWKSRNSTQVANWFSAIGTIECINSLATYAFNHPQNTYPTFVKQLSLQATGMYHPLINLNENVANAVSLGQPQQLLLITGSNMSGKTTFLRTVGTNVLLAQCGLPVCAAQFSFSPMRIYTSIRISDSLQQHTSYFMAELKRLHYIVEQLTDGRPGLVLIDEILRGTNSDDKFVGSYQFVQKLIGYHCLSLFATHDLALSNLQQQHPNQVANYCFESTIENDQLRFDYKILPGVAKNKNASFLMKQMGII